MIILKLTCTVSQSWKKYDLRVICSLAISTEVLHFVLFTVRREVCGESYVSCKESICSKGDEGFDICRSPKSTHRSKKMKCRQAGESSLQGDYLRSSHLESPILNNSRTFDSQNPVTKLHSRSAAVHVSSSPRPLSSLTLPALKNLCRIRHLPLTGLKTNLIERLTKQEQFDSTILENQDVIESKEIQQQVIAFFRRKLKFVHKSEWTCIHLPSLLSHHRKYFS